MPRRIWRAGLIIATVCKFLVGEPSIGLIGESPVQAASVEQTASQPADISTQLVLTLHDSTTPTVAIVGTSSGFSNTLQVKPLTRRIEREVSMDGRVPLATSQLRPRLMPPTPTTGLIDNWQHLFHESFDDQKINSPCRIRDSINDNHDTRMELSQSPTRFKQWLTANDRQRSGYTPASSVLPLDLWLICGPLAPGDAKRLMVEFSLWSQLSSSNDSLFWGVSQDGTTFRGLAWSGGSEHWHNLQVLVENLEAMPALWVGWNLRSLSGLRPGFGAWLADLSLWSYQATDPFVRTCGIRDPGYKGIMLPAYDPTTGGNEPIIRHGDTLAVDALKASGVNWVRLDFVERGGVVDIRAYDRIIDTLCSNGISILGLVNNQTLARRDYNNLTSASDYQREFVQSVSFLAEHFRGRIDTWEVWNEPNYREGAYLSAELYAPLLKATSDAIRQNNPRAKIVFGGLGSAWLDSYQYLVMVYDVLYSQFGEVDPFDILAIHPYADGWQHGGPHPDHYLRAQDRNPGDVTILDRFVKLMAERGDGDKKIWVTEIGWNSSRGAVNGPWCLQQVLVTEREQAEYLKAGLDVLFNEVHAAAVEKVFWYQYMDVGVAALCKWSSPNRVYDSWFGLYRGDKVTPKPIQCAYRSYPEPCPNR